MARKQPLWLMVPLLSLLLFQSRAARAATVIIVGPVNGPPVMVETMVRLKGELTSAGFDTQIVDAPPVAANSDGGSRAALEQMASRRAADALLAIVGAPAMTNGTPDSVEVWVIDNVTGKSVVRRIPFEPASASASKTLAIRAIELLRSSFLEIDLAAHARPTSGAAPPPPPAAVVELVNAGNPAHHRTRRVGVEVGGAALMSLDGVGPAVLPVLRVDWSLRSWLFVQATLAGLGTRPTVTRQVGSADVAQAYGLVGGSVCLRGGEHWRPFATLSAGALETSVDGRANPPNLGHSVGHWSFLVDVGLDVARHLPEPLFLSLGAHAQLAEPSVGVRFADSTVATSGLPNLVMTVTVGAWL